MALARTMKKAGIVLCGGKSSRMGLPKLSLPFGDETMLQRVVRLLSAAVDEVVIVAAEGQEVPPLAAEVRIVRDKHEARGPLEGLSAGLSALGDDVEAAYVTSCDVPLLKPEFVERMFELLRDEDQIVVPKEGTYHCPLSAVYRRSVLSTVEKLLSEDRLRPFYLFEEVPTRVVMQDAWADVDVGCRSLTNLNHSDDYLAALAREGFEPSEELKQQLAASES